MLCTNNIHTNNDINFINVIGMYRYNRFINKDLRLACAFYKKMISLIKQN